MKKYITFGLILLAFSFLISACSKTKDSEKGTADYSRVSGSHTVNVDFKLGKGYTGKDTLKDLTPEEYEERLKETLDPIPDYEIYKGDQLVSQFYFTTSTGTAMSPGLPTMYEQQREKARNKGDLLDEGETDLYEYFLYQRVDLDQLDLIHYTYVAVFKNLEGPGFSIVSDISREEAEKCFKSMTVWFTKRLMRLKNVSVDQEAKTIEADYYPEKSSSSCHMVVNYNSGEMVSSTNPDLIDDHSVYEEQACQELLDYVENGRTEKEFEVSWE